MQQKTKQNRRRVVKTRSNNGTMPDALRLIPEYAGQPVAQHVLFVNSSPLSTTVTTGVINQNTALSSAVLNNFPARFLGYTEFRIVKVQAKVRNFSSVNPGLITHWFSEDDTAAPSAAKANNAVGQRFNASSIDRLHTLSYVPRDPAQQTWTLVATGAPVIGYHKLWTDTSFGSSAIATPYLLIDYEFTIQFRGFI